MKVKKRNKGFILLEILTAIIVFSAGVLFLVQSLSQILKSNQKVINNAYAYNSIDNLLNRLQAQEMELMPQTGKLQEGKLNWQADLSTLDNGLTEINLKISSEEKKHGMNYVFSYLTFDPKILANSF